jgi:hypothetical protein
MAEFLGGKDPEHATAIYVSAVGPRPEEVGFPAAPAQLERWLEWGWDVSRSLWDRRALVLDLDLEYVNFGAPLDVYRWADRPFQVQVPLVLALEGLLREQGVAPLHVLSGRGHHFVWSVPADSTAFAALAQLGQVAGVEDGSAIPFAPWAGRPDAEREAAFVGVGMVLEHLADRAIRRCPLGEVPVELTAVEPGSGPQGREIVSLDLSEYGDPLETRTVRVPFSLYLKGRRQAGGRLASLLPDLFAIPWEGDLGAGLAVMRDAGKVASLAQRVSAAIPDAASGTERLLSAYRASRVAGAHRWFYAQRMHPPEAWRQTYDRTPLEALPRCARCILEDAEGALLTPAGMQLVVRVFLALGWHPRHVAGLIRSRWERGPNRAREWGVYSPARRADFYVRLFTTAFATGLDDLVSFNCRSQGERGACAPPGCARNLLEFRDSLLERRRHDRLAGRPVHGLLLPDRSPGLPGADP